MFEGDFDQPTFADLRLVLKSSQSSSNPTSDLASGGPPAKKRCSGLSSDDVRSFYVHKIILASKSRVINAMLLRAKELRDLHAMGVGFSVFLVPMERSGSVRLLVSPPARQLADIGPEILELPMERKELLAAEVLFRSMYSGDLGEEIRKTLAGELEEGAYRGILDEEESIEYGSNQGKGGTSGYLDRNEGNAMPGASGPGAQGGNVDEKERTALDALLLNILSSGRGEKVDKVILLVRVYQLADRLDVCTDQCKLAMSAVGRQECDSPELLDYLISLKRTAPALAEHAIIKDLLKKSLAWFVLQFSSQDLLWDFMAEEFKELNFPTVLALLDSDEWLVLSENEILTLMGVWMRRESGTIQMSEEQLGEFWKVLRLGHLSTSFLSNLTVVSPWLPVDPLVLRQVATWKFYEVKDPRKAAAIKTMLQSVHGSGVAWFKDKRNRPDPDDIDRCNTCFHFSAADLAGLLTLVQQAGPEEDVHTITAFYARLIGYDIFPTFSVERVSKGSKKTFVLSVGFVVTPSAVLSKEGSQNWPFQVARSIQNLVHVKAVCAVNQHGEQESYKEWRVDNVVNGAHTWELARVDAVGDFSCLGSYLDEKGSLRGQLVVDKID